MATKFQPLFPPGMHAWGLLDGYKTLFNPNVSVPVSKTATLTGAPVSEKEKFGL